MKKNADLKANMEKLLSGKTTVSDNEVLQEYGLSVKGATRYTVLAAALYKKAANGDMSAIKEIRSILAGSGGTTENGVVNIIDDTKS